MGDGTQLSNDQLDVVQHPTLGPLKFPKTMPPEQRNVGAVMKVVMPQLKGVADGNLVRQIVTEELSQ